MASWYTDQLKFATGVGALTSFYGVVSTLIYFLPSEYTGGWKYKIILIACLLITLPFALVIGFVISRRNKKKEAAENKEKEAAGDGQTDTAQPKLSTPGANTDIAQATEETVQFLKSSNLSAGKDAVYALPWYIVAGTPKSGKSSLSLASGLNFQTLPSQRQSEQKFIRPTKNIDWRVTSDAVFLDTAGRYQTEGVDQEEWSSMLETIKKYRNVRPIDGMILTVNTERILQSDEKEVEEIAKVMRARIDEAIQRTKVRFPIYLVFTHADAIEGFRDSFSTSRKEDKDLVWGATIPLEKSQNAHALFDPEYDLLHNSVMKRRLMRLSAPFPPIRQIKIFNFPLHFGSARKRLGNFVSVLFRPNPFSESPFLRGFYFTAVPVNRPQMKGGGQTMTNIAQTVGQSYFTEKLFRDVILRDKDLVATFQAQKVSAPILGWLLTFLGAFLTLALLACAGYSLYKNKQMVDKASSNADAVMTMYKGDKNRAVLAKSPEETQTEIDKIYGLQQSLAEFDDYDRNGAPLLMRFGLYSGDRIFHEKLLPIYFNAIEQRFKKPVIASIEEDLQKFAATPTTDEEILGKNYDLLQAYLMLSKERDDYVNNIEPVHIKDSLGPYWKKASKTPSISDARADEQLRFFASQVSRPEYLGFIPKTKLVADVRKNLKPFSAVIRTYKRIITDVSKKVKAVDVSTIVGSGSQGVFNGTVSVQGAYTIEGYRTFMKDAIAQAKDELAKPDWVLGETQADKQQTGDQDVQRLQTKYFDDYTDKWQKLIADVSIPAPKDPTEASNMMKAFSSSGSPMSIFLKEVARQTNLSANPDSGSWWNYILSFVQPKKEVKVGGDTKVESQFSQLFAFVKDDEKNKLSPLTTYATIYTSLSKELEGKNADDIKAISKEFVLEKGNMSALVKTANTDIGTSAKPFEASDASAAAKEIGGLLRKPINNLKTYLGASGVGEIEKNWTSQIYASAQTVEKGFPFDNTGEADMTKITGYLNPVDGTLSVFFKNNLAKYFEDVTPGQPLKLKESNKGMFSDNFISYLNNAFRLRDALFADKSKVAKFSYKFAFVKVNTDTFAVEGTIDGQPVSSTSTSSGSTNLNFPVASGDSGVALNFTSTGDSGSTSGNTPQKSPTPSVSPNSSPVSKYLQGNSPPSTGITPLKFPGTWGIFKFFDAGSPKKDSTGLYTLTYVLSNKKVLTVTIQPTGGDLFDRTYFSSVHAPEKLK